MKNIFFLFLLFASLLYGQVEEEKATLSDVELSELAVEKEKQRTGRISEYLKTLQQIENEISKEKVWTKSYASYLTSLDVRNSLQKIKKRIKVSSEKKKKNSE